MNKEVIYLEPEDDITDILTKLQQADKKLVALVPPKKATMFRSAVNMKLVARVAKECDKVVVVVTADPAIMKMAMLARIPVAKTLQSRPVVPTEENMKAAGINQSEIEDVIGDTDKTNPSELDSVTEHGAKNVTMGSKAPAAASADLELDEAKLGLDGDSKTSKDKTKKKDKQKSPKDKSDQNFFEKYRKYIMIAAPILLILIVGLVWAFVFAPAATITVAISSTTNNFAEDVRFTTDANAENLEEGILYVEKQTLEEKYTADFTATGEENRGQKATGSVTFRRAINIKGNSNETGIHESVPSGTTISTSDGKTFTTTSSADIINMDGNPNNAEFLADLLEKCNGGTSGNNCYVTASASVAATNPGDTFNIGANTSWQNYESFTISNSQAFSGGTTDIVKVARAADVDQVVEGLVTEHTEEGKADLLEDLQENYIAIDASFQAERGDVSATPAVGDVVGDNTKPNLTATVNYSVYAVAKDKVDQFIRLKTELSEDQQIYNIDGITFDRFTTIEEPARLKATVAVGPIVSEDTIFEKAAGRKTGEVQRDLKAISGVENVEIRTSFFWVNKIPKDRNKVTINLEGEAQPEQPQQPQQTEEQPATQDEVTNSDDSAEGEQQ